MKIATWVVTKHASMLGWPLIAEKILSLHYRGDEWPWERHSDGCPDLNLVNEMYKRGVMPIMIKERQQEKTVTEPDPAAHPQTSSCLPCMFGFVCKGPTYHHHHCFLLLCQSINQSLSLSLSLISMNLALSILLTR